MTTSSRRRFLKQSALLTSGAVSLGAGSLLWPHQAGAATSDYRALICLFLYGGNDGLNMVPPYSPTLHQQYAQVRQSLAIARSSIVPLNADIGLHPAMAPLKDVFDAQRLAIINNVGPLSRPMTRQQYFEWQALHDNTRVPDNLFSHKDQQRLWENATTTGIERTGWGGRLAEALGSQSPVYSFAGNTRFGAGNLLQELVLPDPDRRLGLYGFDGDAWSNARLAALQSLTASASGNALHQALTASQQRAFSISNQLGPLLEQAPSNGVDSDNPELSTAFSGLQDDLDNPLARQLYQAAKIIKNRSLVGGNRHVFFVSLGGFDHHANQLTRHEPLLRTLGHSLQAFDAAMQSLGTSNQATLFTQSDFGRSFKPNGSAGTDHAWGNQQLVMGGAVAGGTSYGAYPSLELGGPDDAGEMPWEHHGRWIPSVSVDQYAATLIKWFAPELGGNYGQILPNLHRFTQHDVGFMS
ncbi:MAG: DUF1501 domain-containing protein [Burkholderiaceae bacterium]